MKALAGFFGVTGLVTSVLYLFLGEPRSAGISFCIGMAFLFTWGALEYRSAGKKVDNILREECRRTCLGGCIHGHCIREGKGK